MTGDGRARVLGPDEALVVLRKFAAAGDHLARFALGCRLLRSGDKGAWLEAVENIRLASETITDALSELDSRYFYGKGVETDRARGIELFVRAAEAWSVVGCYSAGNELMYGRNVEADYGRAYRFLKVAADASDERAMNSLGIMHLKGWHVYQDRREARSLFKKAARMGTGTASRNLRTLRRMGKRTDPSALSVFKSIEATSDDEEGARRGSPSTPVCPPRSRTRPPRCPC